MAGPNKKYRGAGSQELAAAISAILAMAGAGASAQDQQGQSEPVPAGAVLSEVIVTATRRSERLQNVPESISAFDTNAIAMRGLNQMEDYARLVPGLSVSDREPGGNTITFRGVASSGLQFGAVSSSGLYLDEQPITQSGRNPDPRLIDIERLEALRGPQGTLYGASSQSGTLRVITNKADPKAFDAWAEAQISNVKSGATGYDVSAMVNIPLARDRLALRLVGFTAEDAGFIDNVLGASQGGTFDNASVARKDVNSTRTSGGRASLRWDASEDVNATLAAVFQDVKGKGHGDVNQGGADLQQVRFEKETLNDKWYQVALTLNAKLPFGEAVVAGSYFDRDFRYTADATAYEFGFNQIFATCNPAYYNCTPAYDFGGDPRGFATNHEATHITTLEARLSSPSDSASRWAWLAGAFYSKETGKTAFDSFVRGYGTTGSFDYFNTYEQNLTGNTLTPSDTWFLGRYDTELDQVAAFGELSFDMTENFRITAGGRWFDYDRKFAQQQQQPPGFTGYSALDSNEKTSETGNVKKLNLTYRFDDARMMYVTYSEGFRVGGNNPLKAGSILPRSFKSDQLKNYELGLKSEWLDHRLRFNVAAYYMKWDNFAVQVEDPQPIFQLAYVNLPSADFKGIESEYAFRIGNWQIDGAVDWSKAQTAASTTLSFTDSGGTVWTLPPVQEGARLPLSPEWTASLGVEYRPGAVLMNAKPVVRLDYSYVGDSVNSLEGIESVVAGRPPQTQPSYEIVNLRLGLDGEHWSGSFYVDNVFDERATLYINNRWNNVLDSGQRVSINTPRTYGIQLRYEF